MRYALGLEYDGRGFCGWQSQAQGRTVQDQLNQALSAIAGHDIRCLAAGRTDTGVHASHQVVHFDSDAARPLTAWVRGVNRFLPSDIAVSWAQAVDDDFHARFSAMSRTYRYVLLNRPTRPALLSGRVGWFHGALDVAAMHEAAHILLGEHDFSSFRAAECQAKTPVKQLDRFDVYRQGELIIFDLQANAFLHHMVRNLVGALIYIGKGRYPAAWMHELLAARDRTYAPPTFMPDGLYLCGVGYPESYAFPSVTMPVLA